jgi:hypothetical protein
MIPGLSRNDRLTYADGLEKPQDNQNLQGDDTPEQDTEFRFYRLVVEVDLIDLGTKIGL